MIPIRLLASIMFVVAVVSCSQPPVKPVTYPVSGKVLFEGKPAAGAVVILHHADGTLTPDRPRAMADEKGEFTLTTFTNGDGAQAGDYVVTVEWKRADESPEQGVDLLPAMYSDPKTSKLKATIALSGNEPLVLKLFRKP